jgi:hypothetical protein
VLLFWPVGRERNEASFGAILLHCDPTNGNVWRGKYFRPATEITRPVDQSNFEPIDVTWTHLGYDFWLHLARFVIPMVTLKIRSAGFPDRQPNCGIT